MLQQILKDMWVDPEILAELDESQKQTLFCRMREEQVRRWKLWDQGQATPEGRPNQTPGERHVDFLLGNDGEPWVWIMGEHPNDKSIEQILEEEAREKARKLAEKEAEQMRLSVEAELSQLLDLNAKQIEALEATHINETNVEEDSLDIYCSVDEIRNKNLEDDPYINKNNNNNKLNGSNINIDNRSTDKREALNEISLNKPKKVLQRVAMWEKKLMEERTSEIFCKLQMKQLEAKREAEEAERTQERLWREQERRAKEAELQIREIARRAREEHRRSILETTNETEIPRKPDLVRELSTGSVSSISSAMIDQTSTAKPPSKEAVIEWFRSSELARRAGMENGTNTVAPWFHGLITRQEAESLLSSKPPGSFLIRISERIWGYAITYKDTDRCKHYLVDASNGHYQFLGANHITHDTLCDMVNYHSHNPITDSGGELLLHPCSRAGLPAIFQGLLSSSRW